MRVPDKKTTHAFWQQEKDEKSEKTLQIPKYRMISKTIQCNQDRKIERWYLTNVYFQ